MRGRAYALALLGVLAVAFATELSACSTAELVTPGPSLASDPSLDVPDAASPPRMGDGGLADGVAANDGALADAAPPPLPTPFPGDGTPERRVCTNAFGAGLSTTFGRLDGILVSVVPPEHRGCNGDATHIHLQVEANAATYDVAVNVDGLSAEIPHAPVGPAWSEGWHDTEALDYVGALGVHSPAFAPTNAPAIELELSVVNHVSVFATGYGPTGAHLVHRNGNGRDGAIVLNPLGTQARFVMFRFATQSF